MTDMQWIAVKKAGLAMLIAVAFLAIMRINPVIGILLLFLTIIGGGSYMFFLDMEQSKKRNEEYKKRMEELNKMRYGLDKTDA